MKIKETRTGIAHGRLGSRTITESRVIEVDPDGEGNYPALLPGQSAVADETPVSDWTVEAK